MKSQQGGGSGLDFISKSQFPWDASRLKGPGTARSRKAPTSPHGWSIEMMRPMSQHAKASENSSWRKLGHWQNQWQIVVAPCSPFHLRNSTLRWKTSSILPPCMLPHHPSLPCELFLRPWRHCGRFGGFFQVIIERVVGWISSVMNERKQNKELCTHR
jgi:hypothetical protein